VEDGTFGRRVADLVVDPNLGAESAARGAADPAVLLRGARYALLRSLVTGRRGSWSLRAEARRVLVVMGGADPTGVTPRVVEALARTGLDLDVTVLVRPETADAVRAVDRASLCVEVLEPVADLPALAVEHDLVVSAAGTSVWELCCLGLPMALVPVVDNQVAGFERVVDAGAAVGLVELAAPSEQGGPAADGVEVAAGRLHAVLLDADRRRTLAARAAGLVDGLGTWRVVRTWEQLVAAGASSPEVPSWRLRSRRASMEDAGELLRWRNDPLTRSSSRSTNEVAETEHVAWLESSLKREDRLLLVVFDASGDVGVVRWDRLTPGEWEVSVTVAPERRGQGLAKPMLHAGEDALLDEVAALTGLVAVVHEGNEASRRLFAGAGYLPDAPADHRGFATYRKPL
jgi:spore coat polysaccharide biosynthesis predicted glycosyltransferase SpsG/RimJ/RimL family protein N-acetyltransferase